MPSTSINSRIVSLSFQGALAKDTASDADSHWDTYSPVSPAFSVHVVHHPDALAGDGQGAA